MLLINMRSHTIVSNVEDKNDYVIEQQNIITAQHNNLLSGIMQSEANNERNRYNTYSDVNSIKKMEHKTVM